MWTLGASLIISSTSFRCGSDACRLKRPLFRPASRSRCLASALGVASGQAAAARRLAVRAGRSLMVSLARLARSSSLSSFGEVWSASQCIVDSSPHFALHVPGHAADQVLGSTCCCVQCFT